MVENGRLQCQFRRRLYLNEQLEWDLLCNELGPVHGLVDEEDNVEIMGDFSVKKCYELLVQEDGNWDFSKYLWKQGIPNKVSFVLWATFHDSLPTLTMPRHRRVDIQEMKCPFCKTEDETVNHIFLNCSYASAVWFYFIKAFKVDWIFPSSVKGNFDSWKLNNMTGRCSDVWWKLIYAVHWHLWNERNRRVFGGRTMDSEEVIMLIKQSVVL
ncbi:uncharacterized protein LOC113360642 [Papaver somniferum]|uniref:uncharacterized protein LOC113360642 n=1 Tax=Papaver somniferum TaxID=3469 RepID=UPI000E704BFF|nr:uncharacterized protein LOC113360642 [Papaver somniferum]